MPWYLVYILMNLAMARVRADESLGTFSLDWMGSLLVGCPDDVQGRNIKSKRYRANQNEHSQDLSKIMFRQRWLPSRNSPNPLSPSHPKTWISPPDPSRKPWASRRPPSAYLPEVLQPDTETCPPSRLSFSRYRRIRLQLTADNSSPSVTFSE
jgi:hypothetical protein